MNQFILGYEFLITAQQKQYECSDCLISGLSPIEKHALVFDMLASGT